MLWTREFRGKTVVVTGASSGIGRATALAFGALGARVALMARRRTVLDEVAKELASRGADTLVVPTDVTRQPAVRAAFRTIAERFERIDVVVNNAGMLIPAPVAEMRAADLRAMVQVNLFGAVFVMQQAVARMRHQEHGGCIVNVASLGGRRGVSPIGGYCATKFALVGVTEALRVELRGTGIHVALVMPGVIETPMADRAAESELDVWPSALNMPTAWVVWAILAAARFRLVELAVPPGAATLEKLASLVPGLTDSAIHWGTTATRFLTALVEGKHARSAVPAKRGR